MPYWNCKCILYACRITYFILSPTICRPYAYYIWDSKLYNLHIDAILKMYICLLYGGYSFHPFSDHMQTICVLYVPQSYIIYILMPYWKCISLSGGPILCIWWNILISSFLGPYSSHMHTICASTLHNLLIDAILKMYYVSYMVETHFILSRTICRPYAYYMCLEVI